MFIYEYEHEYGEDRFGMVGRIVDPFQENTELKVGCLNYHNNSMMIAERNVVESNNDGSPCYQIVLICLQCRAGDEFLVNNGKEGVIGETRRSHIKVNEVMVLN